MNDRPVQHVPAPSLDLQPGRNCWRRARAERAAPLVDAAAYFSMLHEALHRAQKQILIVGWDIHALMRLKPPAGPNRGSESFRDILHAIAENRPSLDIRLLLWDFTVLYAADRLPFPKAVLDWSMPENVVLELDNRLPTGSSHHQKIVAIDGGIAFAGGIDLTEARWDTPAHAAGDMRRQTARGDAYPPFHDVQLAVDGQAAAALAALCRQRWERCTTQALEPVEGGTAAWPESVEALWTDVEIGISRTQPAFDGQAAAQEVLELYLDSIRAAQAFIYAENQYLTSDHICDALADRLGEADGPEVVLVTQWSTHSWLEENTMGVRRERFLARLKAADLHDRLRVYAPRVPGVDIEDYNLHSKVMVVDDCLVRIGSSNLNNRSMGFDSECDAVVICRSDAERRSARAFRDSLIAEHLGKRVCEVTSEIEQRHSIAGAIDALRGDGRSLVEFPYPEHVPAQTDILAELADTEQPLTARDMLDRLAPGSDAADGAEGAERSRWRLKLALGISSITLLVAAWRFTDLSALAEPGVAADWLARAPNGPAGVLLGIAVFVVGGLCVVPVTAMIVATAFTFGLWPGLITALLGTYLSAAVTFAIGRSVGRGLLERWSSGTAAKVRRRIARNGIVAITVFRVVPIAPFTIINVLAGASPIPFRDFAMGTILGMTPGTVLLVAMGGQLNAAFRDPSPRQILLFGFIVALWLAAGLIVQKLANRLARKPRSAAHAPSTGGD